VVGHEYALPTTGESITRANSENGALPIRDGERGENKDGRPNDPAALNLRVIFVSSLDHQEIGMKVLGPFLSVKGADTFSG
jgi:hypothetical protein